MHLLAAIVQRLSTRSKCAAMKSTLLGIIGRVAPGSLGDGGLEGRFFVETSVPGCGAVRGSQAVRRSGSSFELAGVDGCRGLRLGAGAFALANNNGRGNRTAVVPGDCVAKYQRHDNEDHACHRALLLFTRSP